MVFAAHSSKDSEPLPFASSLANALRLDENTSSDSIFPSLFLSAREKRFSSRLWGLASGACRPRLSIWGSAPAERASGGVGSDGPCSACDCQKRNAPVRRRKAAAAPAMRRTMRISENGEIRHGGTLPFRIRNCQLARESSDDAVG